MECGAADVCLRLVTAKLTDMVPARELWAQ
jgi:hypothetical protein